MSTDHKNLDKIDRKIDELLSAQDLQPSSDLRERILSSTTQKQLSNKSETSSFLTYIIGIGLPVAAAIAVAVLFLSETDLDQSQLADRSPQPALQNIGAVETEAVVSESSSNELEFYEVFALEAELSELAALTSLSEIDLDELSYTLDAATYGI